MSRPRALLAGVCATVPSKPFQRHHRQLAAKRPSLKVEAVRVAGGRASVAVSFATEVKRRKIPFRLRRNNWTLEDVLDTPLP